MKNQKKQQKEVKKMKALSVGCGPSSRWIPNTEGLDIIDFGQKYVCSIFDFNPKEPYDAIFAWHFVEHFDNPVDLMEKLGSLVKIGGVLDIRVPTYPFPQIFLDPTHRCFPTGPEWFSYFTDNSFAGHCYTKCKFKIIDSERDRFEWELHIGLQRVE